MSHSETARGVSQTAMRHTDPMYVYRMGSGYPAVVVSAEDLIEVLESLFPGLATHGEAEPGRTRQPREVASQLVALALDQPGIGTSSEWADLLVLIELLLDKGTDKPWDEFAWFFVEDLLNAVSHGDLPLSRQQVDERLGPVSTRLATHLDQIWAETPNDEPRVMDAATFAAISNPDLRWIVRCMFRRTPNGSYVGAADIVRREAHTGRPGGIAT